VLFNAAQFKAESIPGVVLLELMDREMHNSTVR
jgi:hypothetical protein